MKFGQVENASTTFWDRKSHESITGSVVCYVVLMYRAFRIYLQALEMICGPRVVNVLDDVDDGSTSDGDGVLVGVWVW